MTKILVVDDDTDLRGLVVHRLKAAGHRVLDAPSGAAAMELIQDKGVPDCLVLDVTMPDRNGLEVLVDIREMTGVADLPAVFLSGRIEPEQVAAGQALGAVYLTKPYVNSALLHAIEAHLAKRQEALHDGW